MDTNTLGTTNFVNLLLGAFERLGIPAHLALRGTGINARQLHAENTVVPFNHIHLIFLNGLIVSQRQPDELAFLCGLNTHINAYGSVGLAAMSEATLGKAMDIFLNYLPTYMPGLTIEKKHLNQQVTLTLKKSAKHDDFILELIDCALIGSALAMLKMMTGRNYKRYARLIEVDLPFAKKKFITNNPELSNIHFTFETKVSQVRFHQSLLDFKLPMANPQIVRQIIETHTPNFAHSKHLGGAVKAWIHHALYDAPSNTPPPITQACEHFGMPERSFNRKLKQEGYSYRQLLLEARMLKAEHELKVSNKKISVVASELGYKDVTSFNKAFKKFFDVQPSRLRE